jgi:hypothetical protein
MINKPETNYFVDEVKQIGANSANIIEKAVHFENQAKNSKELLEVLNKITKLGIEIYFEELQNLINSNQRLQNNQNIINQMQKLQKLMQKSTDSNFYQMRVDQLQKKVDGLERLHQSNRSEQTSSILTKVKYHELRDAREFSSMLG